MKQFTGMSKTGNVQEAVRGLSNPKLILICARDKQTFPEKVAEIEALFPGVPSIGCVGQSYAGTEVLENGITVTAFCEGVFAVANVLEEVSSMPVKYIKRLEKDLAAINGNENNTVCIDFCTGNDECALATLDSVLEKKKISLMGGTAWESTVCCNGKVYEDACVYALVKNERGKVKVYKENLYKPTDKKYLVTKAVPENYQIKELDGKPFSEVYTKALGIKDKDIGTQTFSNPLGRILGQDIYIVSLKELQPDKSIICYRKVNPKDKFYLMELGDIREINRETIDRIKRDFQKISGVYSVNCAFRYLLFQQKNYVKDYFTEMSRLGVHSGIIGNGEHFNRQHTNQTMTCVVFE